MTSEEGQAASPKTQSPIFPVQGAHTLQTPRAHCPVRGGECLARSLNVCPLILLQGQPGCESASSVRQVGFSDCSSVLLPWTGCGEGKHLPGLGNTPSPYRGILRGLTLRSAPRGQDKGLEKLWEAEGSSRVRTRSSRCGQASGSQSMGSWPDVLLAPAC